MHSLELVGCGESAVEMNLCSRSDVFMEWEMLTHPAFWDISGLITVSAMLTGSFDLKEERIEGEQMEDIKTISVSAQRRFDCFPHSWLAGRVS